MRDPLGPPGSPLLYRVIPSPAGTRVKRKAPLWGLGAPRQPPHGCSGWGGEPHPGGPQSRRHRKEEQERSQVWQRVYDVKSR